MVDDLKQLFTPSELGLVSRDLIASIPVRIDRLGRMLMAGYYELAWLTLWRCGVCVCGVGVCGVVVCVCGIVVCVCGVCVCGVVVCVCGVVVCVCGVVVCVCVWRCGVWRCGVCVALWYVCVVCVW